MQNKLIGTPVNQKPSTVLLNNSCYESDEQVMSTNKTSDPWQPYRIRTSIFQDEVEIRTGRLGLGSLIHLLWHASLFDLPKQSSQREEFNDWPHGLLTIGTFGNKELRDKAVSSEIQTATYDEQEQDQNPTSASSPDLADYTPEEVGQLQNELTKLLKRKSAKKEEENSDLPLDRFLNCPSSLEVSRRISYVACTDPERKEDDIERTISVIIGKCKEVRAEKTNNAIGKKSLSFLLKKMFVCANGFLPAPSLRDTLQESRMEKLLRTILHKKIYTKTYSRSSSMKMYLEDKHVSERKNDDEETKERPSTNEACKWDKTHSDYIVLEI